MILNRRLKAKIGEQGLNQTQVARFIGVREDRISRIIHGRVKANPDEKFRIAAVLGCKESEIFPEN